MGKPEYEPYSLNSQSPRLSSASRDREQPAADKSKKSSYTSTTDIWNICDIYSQIQISSFQE